MSTASRFVDDLETPVDIIGPPAGEHDQAELAALTTRDLLWDFGSLTAQTPPPPTPRQAAVSADDIGVITDQWAVVVNTVLAPAIANQYVRAARAQAARVAEIVQTANLTEEQLAQFSLPLIDLQEAAQQAASDAANRLANIGDDLWGNARTSLTEGMAAGESVPRLAERVRAATGVTLPRATVIARTESLAARNAGAYDEMTTVARLGIVDSKTWLATHDARTRPTHVAADGQTVPFDAKFTVGGWPADRPHDPALPAEEAANCRCTLLFNLSGEEPVYPLTSSLHTFHLPGKHDQHSHGHGAAQIEDRAAAKAGKNGDVRTVGADRLWVFEAVGQPRDSKGRFASTGGVRDSLANASTTGQIGVAAAGEAKRITGRDIPFDFTGSDPQIAREHAEGVLKGLERVPSARLAGVSTEPAASMGRRRGEEPFAHTVTEATGGYRGVPYDENYRIVFNRDLAANPHSYRQQLEQAAARTPRIGRGNAGDGDAVSVGVHEFGHVASNSTIANGDAGRIARRHAERQHPSSGDSYVDGSRRRLYLSSEVSIYATSGDNELAAEAFTDVLLHPDTASALSQEIMARIEEGPS